MNSALNRGNSNLTGIMIIVFLAIIMLTSPRDDGSNSSSSSFVPGTSITSSGKTSESNSYASGSSVYTRSSGGENISIGSGNASYAYQSYEEYITLENYSRMPVNITGWQLRNGKDKRPYYTGSALQRFSADIAVIPQAAPVLSPSGNSRVQDIVLEDGERAIVTTGSFGSRSPYTITSFKENICTGYIEALPSYSFTPSLTRDCPQPYREPGLQNLDVACRKFIENLSSCETPEFGGRDEEGENCPSCVNGESLPSHCSAFIKEHFSYQGCLIYHQNDSDFSGDTWRIFLGRGWEMWADEYESIELFDRFGQLVNFKNY